MENSELIQQALRYIRTACGDSAITIEDIALHAGFSTSYFNRVFANHTGFSVMEYVRFRRLKTAMRLLSTTDRDILDIALACGYEAHESFSRAFKKQYGRTPSEYREEMAGRELRYGDLYNDTIGARIAHEYPALYPLDRDAVIDWMLDTDAIRYGYEAVCMELNQSAVFSLGNTPADGFITFNEYPGEVIVGEIYDDNYDRIARYAQMVSNSRHHLTLFTSDDSETILHKLGARGILLSGIQQTPNCVYTGQPYALTAPDGISIRELTIENMEHFQTFAREYGLRPNFVEYVRLSLHQRDVQGNTDHSLFQFLLYSGDFPIGLCVGGLQRVRNFVVNNCIEIYLLDGWKREELYRYAYQFVTNAALERGALPFDDIQHSGSAGRDGEFTSADLGYHLTAYSSRLNR